MMLTMTRTIERPTTISGLILMPWVSSSKNRNNPALEAGIGDLFLSFFEELKIRADSFFFLCSIPLECSDGDKSVYGF